MTSRRHKLIDEYLERFDNASVFLPADRREELKQEIVEHIDAGLEAADAQEADAVRTVLDRLGPPANIVAAELSGQRSTGSTPVIKPVALAADTAHKHETDRQDQLQQDKNPEPPTSSPTPRRRKILLIGLAGTVLVVGALAFGVTTSNDAPDYQGPTLAPSQNEVSGNTPPSAQPTGSSDNPTALPSDGHANAQDNPTAATP
ncbi:hypothetical protein ACFV0T_35500 [Streptomyces sp. NPDC059582]|uniref:HAAS signaling domain-containing protein n=1 Tax=Streptomyces sp. NPDC059582 TaxID=3346875 RepID=UPI0036AC136F